MQNKPKLQPVKFTSLQHFIKKIEAQYTPEEQNELMINFEFLVGSFYPNVWSNMMEALKKEHTLGYIEGLKEGQKNEN